MRWLVGAFFLVAYPSISVFLDVPELQDQEGKLSPVSKNTLLTPLTSQDTSLISTGIPEVVQAPRKFSARAVVSIMVVPDPSHPPWPEDT